MCAISPYKSIYSLLILQVEKVCFLQKNPLFSVIDFCVLPPQIVGRTTANEVRVEELKVSFWGLCGVVSKFLRMFVKIWDYLKLIGDEETSNIRTFSIGINRNPYGGVCTSK